jgi:hypothetical protein
MSEERREPLESAIEKLNEGQELNHEELAAVNQAISDALRQA